MMTSSEIPKSEMPLWAQLRISYGFAGPEEIDGLMTLDARERRCMASCTSMDQCSGCVSSKTSGCKPGTACLSSCLQSKQ